MSYLDDAKKKAAAEREAMSKKDDIVLRHPVMRDLEEISGIPGLVVNHVDFVTGDVVVSVVGNDTSFEGVLASLRFVDMVDRMVLQRADFKTGEITVRWFAQGATKLYANLNITKEEIDFIKKGQKIEAIKSVRSRTSLGLADAKNLVEEVTEELRKKGVL